MSRGCVLLANAMIHGFRVAVLLFWFLRHDDRTRKRFQIEGYFHRHVIVPSLSKLYKMSSSCGRHIATTLPPHRRHIAATSPPHRRRMAATSPPHRRHIAAALPPHCRHIAATLPPPRRHSCHRTFSANKVLFGQSTKW